MPFYEYQCAACGAHREELQKVSDRPLRKCPACGKSALKRLLSAPVFRLKGGGWYETDFKGDKDSQRNIAGDKEPAPAEAKPATEKDKDAKPDTKPDAKQDAKAPEGEKPAGGKDAKPEGGKDAKSAADKPAAAKTRSPAAKRRAQRRSASRPGRRR